MPNLVQELSWVRAQMLRLRNALKSLPKLSKVRVASSVHLDIKMVPLFEGLIKRGAKLYITTCNPNTVRDEIANYLRSIGAEVDALNGMTSEEQRSSFHRALEWEPTHLCEMGADLTIALLEAKETLPISASLEATGSGIQRLKDKEIPYPIFNWDDLPIKEGLHNRHMVGVTTWHTFFERTRLSLHEKRVLVIGYGSVGRGVAEMARAYGGVVCISEIDPARALEATYAGWEVLPLNEAIQKADVIVTATGKPNVIDKSCISLLRDGCFLLNVGYRSDEIDVSSIFLYPHKDVLPHVQCIQLKDRTIYLVAKGSMANLTAGHGDSINAFDVTLTVMLAGLSHIFGEGAKARPGLHKLPRSVWLNCLS